MGTFNAARRQSLQANPFARGFEKLDRFVDARSGAASTALRDAGRELVKGIKQVLSTPGQPVPRKARYSVEDVTRHYGTPSRPGEAPHRQMGRLRKSIRMAPDGDAIRVGTNAFDAAWLQFGKTFAAKPARTLKRGRRQGQTTRPLKARIIAPRPFMERGLAAARTEMGKVLVSTLRTKGKEVLGG